jgi:hypothetical protein
MLIAQWVASIGTLALVIVGIVAFLAQRQAANAARDLYDMQRHAAEPNLQRWDRLDDHDVPDSGIVNAPVLVYLRNFGGRPALIERATFFIGDDSEDVELRSAPVVLPGAIAEFSLDWRKTSKLKEERWQDLSLSDTDDRDILGLRVRFCETDGTGRFERTFKMKIAEYRSTYSNSAATMRLLDPQTPTTSMHS